MVPPVQILAVNRKANWRWWVIRARGDGLRLEVERNRLHSSPGFCSAENMMNEPKAVMPELVAMILSKDRSSVGFFAVRNTDLNSRQ